MIRTSTAGAGTKVVLEGNVGVEELADLQNALDSAKAGGEVDVELTDCRSLSSSAIGALIACHNVLVPRGRRLRVRGANEDLLRLLKLMCLDRHFELV
jgi:ABC-type transporter Mla MlaB component